MQLQKILKSLTIRTTKPSSDPGTGHPAHGQLGPLLPTNNGVQAETAQPDLDDLVARHLAQRAARMFEAEEAEAQRRLQARLRDGVPNPPPRTLDPPQIASRARERTQHRSHHRPRDETGHRHPRNRHRSSRPQRDPLERLQRKDRSVRASALATIAATMLDTAIDGRAAAVTLRKTKGECRSAGVPFGELLEEEMEGFGMVPLVYQIIRCNWHNQPGDRDLLLFLLENSLSRKLMWHIRRGCMIRGDDGLFQTLRQLAPSQATHPWDPPVFEYDISVQTIEPPAPPVQLSLFPSFSDPTIEFRALISIPHFRTVLELDAQALQKRRNMPEEKRGVNPSAPLRSDPGLLVEWIACDRAWSLEIGGNSLTLCLQDGQAASLDARMVVIQDERPKLTLQIEDPLKELSQKREPAFNHTHDHAQGVAGSSKNGGDISIVVSAPPNISDGPVSPPPRLSVPPPRPARQPRPPRVLTFQHTTLYPVSSTGLHKVTLAPCFPPSSSFIHSVSASQELLVELTVELGKPNAETKRDAGRRASVGGRSFAFYNDAVRGALGSGVPQSSVSGSESDISYDSDKQAGPSGTSGVYNAPGPSNHLDAYMSPTRRSTFHL